MAEVITYRRHLSWAALAGEKRLGLDGFFPATWRRVEAFSGRNALATLARAMGWGSGDVLLAPALVGEGAIEPFRRAGMGILFYRLRSDLSVDVDSLAAAHLNERRARAVLAVHYYGFPTNILEVRAACTERNLFLIEDCAQALLSRNESGEPLGGVGDAAVFSLGKTLPVPDGAVLLLAAAAAKGAKPFPAVKSSVAAVAAIAFHLVFLLVVGLSIRVRPRRLASVAYSLAIPLYWLSYLSMSSVRTSAAWSRLSRAIVARCDLDNVAEARRRNAHLIYRLVDRNVAQPLREELPRGTVPMGVPLLVRGRDAVEAGLRRSGIYAWVHRKRWNWVPAGRNNEFVNETAYWTQHLVLPVNEGIAATEMETAIHRFNKVCREVRSR